MENNELNTNSLVSSGFENELFVSKNSDQEFEVGETKQEELASEIKKKEGVLFISNKTNH